jgi:5-methylthioadenosine/S-adenosylhomocysteine deaminase
MRLPALGIRRCSDEALTRLADCSRKYDVPLHMHLLETAYQKEYARRRGGGTAVEYIDRFGLLGPRMTLGHGVWLNGRDIQRLAETENPAFWPFRPIGSARFTSPVSAG